MRVGVVLRLVRKDLRASRTSAVILLSVTMPLILGSSCAIIRSVETRPAPVRLSYAPPTAGDLVERVRQQTADEVQLDLEPLSSGEEVRMRLAEDRADLGVVVPAETLDGGASHVLRHPQITPAEAYVAAELERLAGVSRRSLRRQWWSIGSSARG